METEGNLEDIKIDDTPTTTTPFIANLQNYPNPCLFKGWTIEILVALNDCGSLTTKEISNIIGLDIKSVGELCRRGKRNCLFVKVDRWRWMITDYGEYVLFINNKINNNANTNNTPIRHQQDTNKTPTLDSEKKQRQLNLDIFHKNEDLTELQRVVVVAMAKHYEQTGRPYYKVHRYDEFRDQIGLESSYSYEDIQDIVISLEVAGIIYNIKKGDIIKIGLLKTTLEKLTNA